MADDEEALFAELEAYGLAAELEKAALDDHVRRTVDEAGAKVEQENAEALQRYRESAARRLYQILVAAADLRARQDPDRFECRLLSSTVPNLRAFWFRRKAPGRKAVPERQVTFEFRDDGHIRVVRARSPGART